MSGGRRTSSSAAPRSGLRGGQANRRRCPRALSRQLSAPTRARSGQASWTWQQSIRARRIFSDRSCSHLPSRPKYSLRRGACSRRNRCPLTLDIHANIALSKKETQESRARDDSALQRSAPQANANFCRLSSLPRRAVQGFPHCASSNESRNSPRCARPFQRGPFHRSSANHARFDRAERYAKRSDLHHRHHPALRSRSPAPRSLPNPARLCRRFVVPTCRAHNPHMAPRFRHDRRADRERTLRKKKTGRATVERSPANGRRDSRGNGEPSTFEPFPRTQPANLLAISVMFWPPKPKLLESTWRHAWGRD